MGLKAQYGQRKKFFSTNIKKVNREIVVGKRSKLHNHIKDNQKEIPKLEAEHFNDESFGHALTTPILDSKAIVTEENHGGKSTAERHGNQNQ